MPYIRVETNVVIENPEPLKRALGQAISLLLGKSEAITMVLLNDGLNMSFSGDSSPCAMVETQVNPSSDLSTHREYAARLQEILSQHTGIPAERIFLTLSKVEFWHGGKKKPAPQSQA